MKGNFTAVLFLNKNAVEAVPYRLLQKTKASRILLSRNILQFDYLKAYGYG